MSSRKLCLVCVVLCGLPLPFTAIAWGQTTSPKDSSLLSEQTIPEPPRQKEAWKPPATKVPDNFVKAAALLFEQGLADPRGCEYRAIELTDGTHAHGWVLPAKDGDRQRFAIRWNGLVRPLVSVGDKVDLKKDAVIPSEQQGPSETEDSSWQLWGRGDVFTALLLRLGEGDLASQLWAAHYPLPPTGNQVEAKEEPYPELASVWGWHQFHDGEVAYQDGDDAAALLRFRKAMAFIKVAEPEAKKRGFEPRWRGKRFLDEYMDALPGMVADLERRVKDGKREAAVCFGPGRIPDPQQRIAALILRLDEVKAPTWGLNHAIIPNFERDPIVVALIREGEPAVEPLLKCYVTDKRLTRSIGSSGGYCRCEPVSEPAYVALAAILDFSPRSTDEEEDREKLAARFRERLQKGRTRAERLFQVLADDKAQPRDWLDAAAKLLSPLPAIAPETAVWSIQSTPPPYREQRLGESFREQRLGESLRRKKDPSVTELLLKRVEQTDGEVVHEPVFGDTRMPQSVALALMLAEWEPKAALEPLAAQTKRARDAGKWTKYTQMIEKRVQLGDRKALDEYATVITAAHPRMLRDWWSDKALFQPLGDHLDNPSLVKAAEALFADDNSPWLPLIHEGDRNSGAHGEFELIPTTLLRQPAFRKAVLKELADKTKVGKATLNTSGFIRIDAPFGLFWTQNQWRTPKEKIEQDCRRCDLCAWKLGQDLKSAPRCELYWTEAERDKAVTACIDFLRRQQYELEWRSEGLRLDKPASAAQVEQGQAVFTLAGVDKVRLFSGLKLPQEGQWITLKDHPLEARDRSEENAPVYAQRGKVVQAEEVFKDGKWQRYYGFVGVNHVARVPASEIEFSPEEPSGDNIRDWVRVGPGLHVRLKVPSIRVESIENYPPRLPADAALTFSLLVRNSAGLEQPSPDAARSVRLRLLYSPEMVSRQGALVPKAVHADKWLEMYEPDLIQQPGPFIPSMLPDTGWTDLPSKPGAKFSVEKSKELAVAEEMKLATFDLREWFDVSLPGFYRLQLLPAAAEAKTVRESGEIRFSLAAPPRNQKEK